jgi:hypothetical protein
VGLEGQTKRELGQGGRRTLDLADADRLAVGGNGEPGGSWIWVSPITTLAAAYRDAHPGDAQQLAKVNAFLAIGARESINRPFSSVPDSRFSPRAFLQAAGSQNVPAYAASLVPQIDAGLVHAYVEPGHGGVRAKSLFNLPLFVNNPTFKGFAQNIWGGGMLWSLASKDLGLGKLAGLLGLHSSTTISCARSSSN